MCSPFRAPEPPRCPTAFNINYGVTWRRGMFGANLPVYGGKLFDYQNQLRRTPITEAPPASRIIPRKVPGMEDRMSFWDYIFPARRRRREEERQRAIRHENDRLEMRLFGNVSRAVPQRAYAAHVANTRQASPDTSFDLTSPLNLMSPLHPFNPLNPINPINMGANYDVPAGAGRDSVGNSSYSGGGSDSGSSYSGSSDSGGSSSGSGE